MLTQPISPVPPPFLNTPPILGLLSGSYAVLAVASARIYHAQLGPKPVVWCYSRMRGTLVFGKDLSPDAYDHPLKASPIGLEASRHWFRLLDADSGKPIWMFKIPAGFVYELDRPFFHAFQGRSRRFGFLFEDDEEASVLCKAVFSQTSPPQFLKNRTLSFSMRSKSPTSTRSISPSMVSRPTPNSFVHVAHVGLNKEGVVEASKGIDPSWAAVLSGHGSEIRNVDGEEHINFREGLLKGLEAIKSNNFTDQVNAGHENIVPPGMPRRRLPAPSFTMF
ncbi:Wiskott-Aldrich syndrome 1 [Hypsizygus marmoreus]|uniref:Wiskott-Aldrich syndrome 1 n=1 Tax=Hypsizygus marmoreus TaxID=39966 RepID=A0A369JEV5_HYPMA|nr:Wiskott-Aldrich syndrome 1 [Hypsizygus marmoreus]